MIAVLISTLSFALLTASAAVPAAMPVAGQPATTAAEPERDPICGMNVDAEKARAAGRISVYEGKTYYFCNDSCKKQFDADPAKYVKKSGEKAEAPASGCCCKRHASGSGMNGSGCCH